MIVYGDPQYTTSPALFARHLEARLLRCEAGCPAAEMLPHLRGLLIGAGQLEQSLSDADPPVPAEAVSLSRTVTEGVASAFFSLWASLNRIPDLTYVDVRAAIENTRYALHRLGHAGMSEAEVCVKLPEGYAFYKLYPEQYCASILRWLADHAEGGPESVVVVGIRSTGTSLAALLTAALRSAGWRARGITVRPAGEPFNRAVAIEPEHIGDARWGLVVDEGPGISGSSMAAAADALLAVGIARECVCFFPSHGGEPGGAGAERVQEWWAITPRYTTALTDTLFNGQPLLDLLCRAVEGMTGVVGCVTGVEDIGGGLWRANVYSHQAEWPPVCPHFERAKYRLTLDNGRRLLLKSQGLAILQNGLTTSEACMEKLGRVAELGRTPAPLGEAHGFVVLPWVEGAPLSPSDATPEVVAQVGRYIADVAAPPLSRAERASAWERLDSILYWNSWESLGEAEAEVARRFAERVKRSALAALDRRYGDGHMAPHEWLRTLQGQLLKLDGAEHEWDHTAVGPQPIMWDLAGAICEWRLDADEEASLLDAFYSAGGSPILRDMLLLYRMAYLAFRVGQCHLCAGMSGHDPAEQARLWSAYSRYSEELRGLLTQ